MKAAMLIRAGSITPHEDIAGRLLSGVHDSSVDFHWRDRSIRMSLDLKLKRDPSMPMGTLNSLRRVQSDTDLIRSDLFGSGWLPPVRLEEEEEINLAKSMSSDFVDDVDEMLISGGGMGNGKNRGGSSNSRGDGEHNRENKSTIGSYYQEMLKSDPGNPLLLRNYGRYLHEVEKDLEKAEEYYGRAILANPNDGELLSLYGRLAWESQRDNNRAEGYYERAVAASPDDCYVMASYAHFLWEEEDEEHVERLSSLSPIVAAF